TISAHSDVRVVLRQPVEGWTNDMELPSGLFTVKPRVKGKVVALDNETIAFIPEEPLKQDTEYNITLDLEEIIPDIPSEFEEFTFMVKTIKQQFNVTSGGLQSYSKDWQYVDGILRSSDQLDLETAKKLIKVTQKDKELKIKFNEGVQSGTQIPFKIDSIRRFEEDSEIKISWDGAPFNIDSKGNSSLTIPGKSN